MPAPADTADATQTRGLRLAALRDASGSSVSLFAVRAAERHFDIAVSQVPGPYVYVHVVGALDHRAAEAVSGGFAPLLARSLGAGQAAGPSPNPVVVLLDLSGLHHLDDVGLSALHRAVVGLTSCGWQVRQSRPHGSTLRLLDSAARAGWVPPKLTCTDVLHWEPYATGTAESERPCPCC